MKTKPENSQFLNEKKQLNRTTFANEMYAIVLELTLDWRFGK